MIISKDKLIARLGDKTGLEPEQVQDQLTQLVEAIQKSVEEGQSYEIPGFGTFAPIDGELQFTPDNVLETEINNKYAGMRPIELIGAFKESETGEMPEMTAASGKEEETWAFDPAKASVDRQEKDADVEQEADVDTQSEEAPAPDLERESVPSEAEEPPAPPVDKADEEKFSPEPVVAGTEDEDQPEADVADEEELAEVTPEDPSETEEATESKSKKPSKEAEEDNPPAEKASKDYKEPAPKKADKDPIGRFLAIAASILLIGIVGWLGYEFLLKDTIGSDRSLNNETAQQASAPSQQDVSSQAVSDGDREGTPPVPDDEPAAEGKEKATEKNNSELEEVSQVIKEEGSMSQSERQSDSSQEEPYGLRGEVDESLNSWYTIVLHSLKDADKAEVNRQQLQSEGYRAMIKQVQLEEGLQYRVGIGQFSSVEEALQAAGELSEPYKSNNFIKRF